MIKLSGIICRSDSRRLSRLCIHVFRISRIKDRAIDKMKIGIVGISGKLGLYMTEECLQRGWTVSGVCRPDSVKKVEARFAEEIACRKVKVYPGFTDNRTVMEQAISDCDHVLTVLAPWSKTYSSDTAQAVLDFSKADARLIFSCGWHISMDGKDVIPWKIKAIVAILGPIGKLLMGVNLDDQVYATNLIFASDKKWTVVRGSDLEEGPSQGLPIWSEHVGDKAIESNLTRRIDFAKFMVQAVLDDALIHKAPAICGCETPSAKLSKSDL
jgi:hypothetical protein